MKLWQIFVLSSLLLTACGSISNLHKIKIRTIDEIDNHFIITDIPVEITENPEAAPGIFRESKTQYLNKNNTKTPPSPGTLSRFPSPPPTLVNTFREEFSISLVQKLEKIKPVNVSELIEIGEIRFTQWDIITALRWSHDGKLLAVAVGDKLEVYELGKTTPTAVRVIGALTPGLDFSQDGRWLAAGSKDGMVRIFNPQNLFLSDNKEFLPILEFPAHKKGVNSLDFSDTEVNLLATGGNDAVARFWDVHTGENLGIMIGGTFSVPAIAFSPNGTSLAVVNGDTLRIREFGTERIIGSFLSDSPLYCLVFSPDGGVLAVGDLNNRVLLWDPHQGFRTGSENYPEAEILTSDPGDQKSPRPLIWRMDFNPSGDLLASVGGDGALRIWDVTKKSLLGTQFGHSRGATSVDFHPGGILLVSGGLDGTIKFWGILQQE